MDWVGFQEEMNVGVALDEGLDNEREDPKCLMEVLISRKTY